MRRSLFVVLVGILLAACSSQSAPDTNNTDIYAYSLVAPLSASPSGLVARAVLPADATCPQLDVTGAESVAMQEREAAPTTNAVFDDVVVCSAPIPKGASGVSIGGVQIPAAMPREVQSIASLADTGCMVFKKTVQDCNSTTEWPFGELSQRIADARPSLIIHAGDYFYREYPCPTSDSDKCGGSPAPPKGVPFLDSGAGWLADFFEPAKPMLNVAPLMAMRGNHEVCGVAGNGYFLFLDPRPDTAQVCAPRPKGSKLATRTVVTKPWKVDVASSTGRMLRLIAVDSSHGWTDGQSPWWRRLRPNYQKAYTWAQDKTVEPWLITHQPSLGLTSVKENPGSVPDWLPWVSGDQMAASHGLLAPYVAILSGHLHLSQVIKIPGLPTQFIVGGGGTYLDRPDGYVTPKYGPLSDSKGNPVLPGVEPYPPASYKWIEIDHAFALGTPNEGQAAWDIKYVAPDGSTLGECVAQQSGDPQC